MASLGSDLAPINLTFRTPRAPFSSDRVAEEDPNTIVAAGGEDDPAARARNRGVGCVGERQDRIRGQELPGQPIAFSQGRCSAPLCHTPWEWRGGIPGRFRRILATGVLSANGASRRPNDVRNHVGLSVEQLRRSRDPGRIADTTPSRRKRQVWFGFGPRALSQARPARRAGRGGRTRTFNRGCIRAML